MVVRTGRIWTDASHSWPATASEAQSVTRFTDPSRFDTPAIDEHRLRGHVQRLAGEIGERNVFKPHALAEAAEYIEATWRDQGYEVARQWYEVSGVRCANLEITRRGRRWPGEILLIGAHYDSVSGSPGANDNASGVAALMEISRLFTGFDPAVTVRFVAFTNEEAPFFTTKHQGSMVYARAARVRGDGIRLAVVLETIGFYSDEPRSQRYPPFFRLFYPDCANFIGFVSNFSSRRITRRAARLFRDQSDFPLEHVATFEFIPGVNWSDHRSFWRHGYHSFMVTDTAFYRYPYYHTDQDTPDKLAYAQFSQATISLHQCFAAIALSEIS